VALARKETCDCRHPMGLRHPVVSRWHRWNWLLVGLNICMYLCTYLYMCTYTCRHIYIYLCIYIYLGLIICGRQTPDTVFHVVSIRHQFDPNLTKETYNFKEPTNRSHPWKEVASANICFSCVSLIHGKRPIWNEKRPIWNETRLHTRKKESHPPLFFPKWINFGGGSLRGVLFLPVLD